MASSERPKVVGRTFVPAEGSPYIMVKKYSDGSSEGKEPIPPAAPLGMRDVESVLSVAPFGRALDLAVLGYQLIKARTLTRQIAVNLGLNIAMAVLK